MTSTPRLQTYSSERLTALLPMPALDTHKYARGVLNLVAGSAHYPGAACLAALAAQRSGAGYTRVITESTNVPFIQAYRASFVVRSWAELTPAELVPSREGRPCAYAVGCGFDPESEPAARITATILERVEAPVVVDGGALAFAATGRGMHLLQRRHMLGRPTVLTPHAGEAARLVHTMMACSEQTIAGADALKERSELKGSGNFKGSGESKELDASKEVDVSGEPDMSEDPAQRACALARAYGAIVVLKGPNTYISNGKDVVLVDCGTPALAKAGTGDVLSGMMGALLAQGMDPMDAAVLAVTLHAQAGRAAAALYTEICVTPEDVIEAIPQAVKAVANASDAAISRNPEGAKHEGGKAVTRGGNHGKR